MSLQLNGETILEHTMKEKFAVRAVLKNNLSLMEFVLSDDGLLADKEVLKSKEFLNMNYSAQLLVKIARNLFSGEGELSFYHIAQNLDDENYNNFLSGLTALRV